MIVNWEKLRSIEGMIVVVEDDPMLSELIAEILGEIGLKSISFGTADDALTHLINSGQRCALVIADHGVPGQIKGIEFIEMVQGRWPAIKAILTSGYLVDPLDVPKSAIYLHKPWSLDQMVTAVASLLQPDNPIQKR